MVSGSIVSLQVSVVFFLFFIDLIVLVDINLQRHIFVCVCV